MPCSGTPVLEKDGEEGQRGSVDPGQGREGPVTLYALLSWGSFQMTLSRDRLGPAKARSCLEYESVVRPG